MSQSGALDLGDPSPDHGVATPPALLTVAETSAMLRVSKMTIYRLIDTGQLPALRVGKSYRIPRESIRTLLGVHTARAASG